jgi:hypothetical protein
VISRITACLLKYKIIVDVGENPLTGNLEFADRNGSS